MVLSFSCEKHRVGRDSVRSPRPSWGGCLRVFIPQTLFVCGLTASRWSFSHHVRSASRMHFDFTCIDARQNVRNNRGWKALLSLSLSSLLLLLLLLLSLRRVIVAAIKGSPPSAHSHTRNSHVARLRRARRHLPCRHVHATLGNKIFSSPHKLLDTSLCRSLTALPSSCREGNSIAHYAAPEELSRRTSAPRPSHRRACNSSHAREAWTERESHAGRHVGSDSRVCGCYRFVVESAVCQMGIVAIQGTSSSTTCPL